MLEAKYFFFFSELWGKRTWPMMSILDLMFLILHCCIVIRASPRIETHCRKLFPNQNWYPFPSSFWPMKEPLVDFIYVPFGLHPFCHWGMWIQIALVDLPSTPSKPTQSKARNLVHNDRHRRSPKDLQLPSNWFGLVWVRRGFPFTLKD